MNDNVVPLKPETPHVSGQCLECGHRWVATAPVGTVDMECSAWHGPTASGTMHGHETGYYWTCNCGSSVYNLTPTGALCCGCGLRAAALV